MALETEIAEWRHFRDALSPMAQEAFDELMDMCRGHATASGNVCNPIIFEPMIVSILLSQQRKLIELEGQLNEILLQDNSERNNTL